MFTQPFLSAKLSKFFQWSLQQEMKLRGWLQQLILKLAILQAFRKFVLRHPRWAASLFDEYFLMGQAAPLLARYVQSATLPTPAELVTLWADQLGPLAPSPYSPRRLEAQLVAADFLKFLESELRHYQVPFTPANHTTI